MIPITSQVARWLCAISLLTLPALTSAETEDHPADIAALEAAVRKSSRDGDAWVRLGQAYLEAGQLRDAERAFRRGVRHAKSAEAHHGLGLVYMNSHGKAQQALYEFRQALGIDPTLVEVQMDIARVYVRLQNVASESAMKKAIEIAPDYAPAHKMLAEWYRDRGYDADALEVYRNYLALRPDDADGYEGLVMGYVGQQRYRPAAEMSRAMSEQLPEEVRWLGLAGQAYAARGDVDRALEMFETYLSRIAPEERALYEDLSLVAPPKEEKAYQEMSEEDREVFLEAFWRRRDPMLVFGGRARQVEHYRRVWYARTFFSRGKQPWDRRGEIYIRYGEPDYRSYSYRENALPSLSVRSIKERNAFALYESGGFPRSRVVTLWEIPVDTDGDGGIDMETVARPSTGEKRPHRPRPRDPREMSRPGADDETQVRVWELPPGWIWFVRQAGPYGQVYLNKPPDVRSGRFIEPVFPIERQADGRPVVPWESWVYVHVGEGIEFVFVDPYGTGAWEFPIVPTAVARSPFSPRIAEYDPGVVHQRLKSEAPEYYGAPPGMEPLAFVYDLARFRGDAGRTKMEVYFGIPLYQVALEASGDRHLMEVERSVVLLDDQGNDVVRHKESRSFEGAALRAERGTFALDLAALDVSPGKYRLGVWLMDSASGKWGSYLQEVEIPAYRDSLSMSDLAMSYQVSQVPADEQFRKGDVWVIPMPGRNYRSGQGIFVYYEVYNFERDAFNQTRYRVEYAIRQDIRLGGGMLHAMAGVLNRLFADQRPAVSVSYEREGDTLWEPMYLEVTPDKLKAGWNQISVTVTDLNSGQAVSQSAIFQLEPGRNATQVEPIKAESGQE